MPEKGVRSPYSQAPFRISTHDLGGQISTATAFHYLYNGKRFIITNWHNLTGRDFFSGKNLNELARTPIWIEVHTAVWQSPATAPDRSFGIASRRVEIYGDPEAQFDRLWLEHPQLGGGGCDIVAILDPKPDHEPEFMHNSVNKISDARVPVLPGELAFVIGYPRGSIRDLGFPSGNRHSSHRSLTTMWRWREEACPHSSWTVILVKVCRALPCSHGIEGCGTQKILTSRSTLINRVFGTEMM